MRLPLFALLMFSSLAMAQGKPAVPPAKVTYLWCGSLYDGKSDSLQKMVTVRIVAGKIDSVKAGKSAEERGAEVIDLSNEVCLPGLIDTHTHVLLQGDITAEDYDVQLLKWSTPYRTILGTVAAKGALGVWLHDDSRSGDGRCGLRRCGHQEGDQRRRHSRAANAGGWPCDGRYWIVSAARLLLGTEDAQGRAGSGWRRRTVAKRFENKSPMVWTGSRSTATVVIAWASRWSPRRCADVHAR